MVVEADTSNGAGQDLGPIVAHAEGALALFGEEPAPGNLVNGSNNVSWGTTSSLNYLAAKLASYTGLPLTNFQQYQLDGLNIIPAQNMNAYLSPLGIRHYYDGASTGSTTQHLNDAAILQYDNLFNKSKDKSAYWVTPGYQAPAN